LFRFLCSKVYESAQILQDLPSVSQSEADQGPEPTWPAGQSDQKHATRKEAPGRAGRKWRITALLSEFDVILWDFDFVICFNRKWDWNDGNACIDTSTTWKRTKNIGWYFQKAINSTMPSDHVL
jgi:hypothetical protein